MSLPCAFDRVRFYARRLPAPGKHHRTARGRSMYAMWREPRAAWSPSALKAGMSPNWAAFLSAKINHLYACNGAAQVEAVIALHRIDEPREALVIRNHDDPGLP